MTRDGWFMPTLRDGRAAARCFHLFRAGFSACRDWRWQTGFKAMDQYPEGAFTHCKGCSAKA